MAPSDDDDLNTILLKELECPVCYQHCTPPILSCPESHSVCTACLEQLSECPICRGPKPSIRNRLAETVSGKVKFPCTKNVDNGCSEMFTLQELEAHVTICDYRCKCYAGTFECTWQGNRNELFAHVFSVHSHFIGGGTSYVLEYQMAMFWQNYCDALAMLFEAHEQYFWVRLCYEQDPHAVINYYCFSAMCVGSKDTAAKFQCEFRFSSADRSYQNILRVPMNYEHNSLVNSPEKQNIKLNETFIKYFICNEVLRCTVTILER